MKNLIKGRGGEALAEAYLKRIGYVFVDRNYRCQGSEIDLIFIDPIKTQKKELEQDIAAGKIKENLKPALIKNLKNMLVFVEVKMRSSDAFGKPYEAVGEIKKRHMMRGANNFLQENDLQDASVRFDIISIEGEDVCHIKDAF